MRIKFCVSFILSLVFIFTVGCSTANSLTIEELLENVSRGIGADKQQAVSDAVIDGKEYYIAAASTHYFPDIELKSLAANRIKLLIKAAIAKHVNANQTPAQIYVSGLTFLKFIEKDGVMIGHGYVLSSNVSIGKIGKTNNTLVEASGANTSSISQASADEVLRMQDELNISPNSIPVLEKLRVLYLSTGDVDSANEVADRIIEVKFKNVQ